MNIKTDVLRLACWIAAAAAAVGCQTPPAAPSAQTPGGELDSCPERLHDICGQLLLYYSVKGHSPERLDQLGDIRSGALPPLICPVSGKPYTYNRDGLAIPESTRRVLVYDAEPSHSGKRWAIVADAAQGGKPLVARVLLMAEAPVFATGQSPKP